MPEGDTIYQAAVRLRGVLTGQCIVAIDQNGRASDASVVVGQRVGEVESRGKHLLIHFDSGHVMHSHLGMTGSWHTYEMECPWRKPARWAWVALYVERHVAVCFTPKLLEVLTPTQFRRHRYLGRLGPDLLGQSWDARQVVTRFGPHAQRPVGEAIMDQTIVCGIGNIYKSEILFHAQLDPFAPVGWYSDVTLTELLEVARRLMRRNLTTPARRTRFAWDGPRCWVYGRDGQPCLKCGATIRVRRQGDLGRTTYWCPACQPSVAEPQRKPRR